MKVIDLFAGCGGFSLGIESSLEMEVIAAYELWDSAIKNYKANLGSPIFQFDLKDVESAVEHIQHFSPDMIVGGPPCQDFSHAGSRVEGQRANLTVCFALIVSKIKPLYFVMENVDRARNSEAMSIARKILQQSHYGLTEKCLDASYCGVPQKRKRYFCIGGFKKEEGFINSIIDQALASKPMTVRDYLGDELTLEYYYRHPRNYNRRGIFSIDEPSPTIRGVNRPVPKGYRGHHQDPVPITDNLRPLTTHERARLQTFPKDYHWIGTKTEVELMIGNAVPVNLAKFISNRIYEFHHNLKESYIQLQLNLLDAELNNT